MKLLITGALGFVGVNLVRTLAGKPDVTVIAADLHAPDALTTRFLAPVAAQIRFAVLDVTDRRALHDLVAEHAITHIIHGAAVTPSAEQEAAETTAVVDINLGGVINALDAALQPSVARFVFLSSSGVYGISGQTPHGRIDEDAPLVLDNLYAITKRAGELLTARYATLHSKPMTAMRLGPIYGLMEQPSASRARLSAPGQLLAAWRGQQPVSVAGAGVTRDWTYAGDVGEAIWALLNAPTWRHAAYNLSYGRPVALREMVAAFAAQGLTVTWRDALEEAEIVMQPTQTRTPMDGTRLYADTGYRAATTPDQGVALTVAASSAAPTA